MQNLLLNILVVGLFGITTLAHLQPSLTDRPSGTAPKPSPVPALNNVDRNKYFHEPGNHEPGQDDRLGHYDSRYFHGLVSLHERTETLTHLTRSYLITFRKLGFETWIAHGTLLGWWWNGKVSQQDATGCQRPSAYQTKILPWDWDVDTQVSVPTLKYMAVHHNRTIYKYSSADNNFQRTYLLDVNPWSEQRDPGDGANIIDARWIDMANGLYIDITGLSEISPDQKPGIWSCKNRHNYRLRDLYPMRESMFEGVPASIPYAYHQILMEEYMLQALVNITHKGYGATMVVA